MTYQALEVGAEGRPLELYLFERRGVCWPYTSADGPQVFQGLTYNPVTISRGAFERNEDSGSSEVRVNLDRTVKLVAQFIDGNTPFPVKLRIYRKHRNDSDFIVLFKGIVANASLAGEEIVLTCVSPLGTDEKSVPRHIIMRTCPHVLYGPKCALDPRDWDDDSGAISSITGNVVRVNGAVNFGSGYYSAGVLVHEPTGERAFVQKHVRSGGFDDFTLLQPPVGWAASDGVIAYAGCDRKHTTCRDKFDNIPNFGGFPLHPERNPIYDLTADLEPRAANAPSDDYVGGDE